LRVKTIFQIGDSIMQGLPTKGNDANLLTHSSYDVRTRHKAHALNVKGLALVQFLRVDFHSEASYESGISVAQTDGRDGAGLVESKDKLSKLFQPDGQITIFSSLTFSRATRHFHQGLGFGETSRCFWRDATGRTLLLDNLLHHFLGS
jgi:hypothetical protein